MCRRLSTIADVFRTWSLILLFHIITLPKNADDCRKICEPAENCRSMPHFWAWVAIYRGSPFIEGRCFEGHYLLVSKWRFIHRGNLEIIYHNRSRVAKQNRGYKRPDQNRVKILTFIEIDVQIRHYDGFCQWSRADEPDFLKYCSKSKQTWHFQFRLGNNRQTPLLERKQDA